MTNRTLQVCAPENVCICLLLPVHHQVTAKYFSEYNISGITISMYAPGQEEGETVVTCSLELSEDAVDNIINRYSNSRKKRDFEFLQEPVIYGFRPASVLECAVYSVEMFCVMCWKVLCMLCFVFECVCVCFVIFSLKTLNELDMHNLPHNILGYSQQTNVYVKIPTLPTLLL